MNRPHLAFALLLLLFLAFPAKAAPLELDELRQQYEKLLAERVTTPYETALTALNTKFSAALDSAASAAKQAGKLDEVLAIQADAKLIADKQPLPAEDAEGTPEALKNLRAIYREQSAKIETDRAANAAALDGPFLAKLEELEVTLTRADRIDDATKVREFRGTVKMAEVSIVKESTSPAAPIGTPDTAFAGGRLYAVGKIGPPPGVEIDLTAAEGINDFVDVTGNQSSWVALRRDGTAVGWHVKSGTFSRPGIKKITGLNGLGDLQLMGITTAGTLMTLTTGEPVNDATNVIDAVADKYHGLALLADDTVKTWGPLYAGPVSTYPAFPAPAKTALTDAARIGVSRYSAWVVGRDGSFRGWGPGTIHDLPSEFRGGTELYGYPWGFFAATKRKDFFQFNLFTKSGRQVEDLPDQVRGGEEVMIQLIKNHWTVLYQHAVPALHNEHTTLETLDGLDLPFFFKDVNQEKTTTSYLLWLSADDPG